MPTKEIVSESESKMKKAVGALHEDLKMVQPSCTGAGMCAERIRRQIGFFLFLTR